MTMDAEAFEHAGTERRKVVRFAGSVRSVAPDDLADEVPVALEYNGISHAVMLATPCDLEAFAVGFTLSEGIVAGIGDIYEVEVEHGPDGITVHLRIEGGAFARLKEKRRNLTGRTGCGLCGTEDLGQVLRPLPQVKGKHALKPSAVQRALEDMKQHQPINRKTGATHAAAWCDGEGRVLAAFEDVGRHNALDKLIGFMAREKIDPTDGFLAMTSRASVELVQKAASLGMPALVAISAPTALAVRTAEACGMILLAFARGDEFVAYAHAEKLAQN
ncbi:MAG TPA: formate dehydrogenase accessory sulfurtransferase FdhD [Burkholderiaceae bacterium]